MKSLVKLLTVAMTLTLSMQSCDIMLPPDGPGPRHHEPRPRPHRHHHYGLESTTDDATYKFSAQEATPAATPFADEKEG